MRDQEHNRSKPLHHHDKHAAHKSGHRPDDPHGVTAPTFPISLNRDTRRGKMSDPITDPSDDPNPHASYKDITTALDIAEEEYDEYRKANHGVIIDDEGWELRQNWLDAQDIERNRFRQIMGAYERGEHLDG